MGSDVDHDASDARTRAVEMLLHTPAPELMARMNQLQASAIAAGLTPKEVGDVLNRRDELPRDLLPNERATLLAVLNQAPFEGRGELTAQVQATRVSGYCGCGCATVDLTVDPTILAPAAAPSPVPNDAQVVGPGGEDLGGILVFVREGYLSLLEVYGYESRLSPMPPPEALEFAPRSPGTR